MPFVLKASVAMSVSHATVPDCLCLQVTFLVQLDPAFNLDHPTYQYPLRSKLTFFIPSDLLSLK